MLELFFNEGKSYLYDSKLVKDLINSLSSQVSPVSFTMLEKFGDYAKRHPTLYSRLITRDDPALELRDYIQGFPDQVRKKQAYVLDAGVDSRLRANLNALAEYMQSVGQYKRDDRLDVDVVLERALKYVGDEKYNTAAYYELQGAPELATVKGYTLRELVSPMQFAVEAKRLEPVAGRSLNPEFQEFQLGKLRVLHVAAGQRPVATLFAPLLQPLAEGEEAEPLTYYPAQRDYSGFAVQDIFCYETPGAHKRDALTEAEDAVILVLDYMGLNTGLNVKNRLIGKTRSGNFQRIDRPARDPSLLISALEVRGFSYKLPSDFRLLEGKYHAFYGSEKVTLPELHTETLLLEGVQKFSAELVKANVVRVVGAGEPTKITAVLEGGDASWFAFSNTVFADTTKITANTVELSECPKLKTLGSQLFDAKHILLRQAGTVNLAAFGNKTARALTLSTGDFGALDINTTFPACNSLVQDHANIRSYIRQRLDTYSIFGYHSLMDVLDSDVALLNLVTLESVPEAVKFDTLRVEYIGEAAHKLNVAAKDLLYRGPASFLPDTMQFDRILIEPPTPQSLVDFVGKALTAKTSLYLKLPCKVTRKATMERLLSNWRSPDITLIADDASWFPPARFTGVSFCAPVTSFDFSRLQSANVRSQLRICNVQT